MRLLKIPEVAQRLSCSESTVRRLIETKKLGCHRFGAIRISELHVQKFLDATEEKPAKPGTATPPKKKKAKTTPANRLKHIRIN